MNGTGTGPITGKFSTKGSIVIVHLAKVNRVGDIKLQSTFVVRQGTTQDLC
jgi:hypothetical protein